MTAYLPNFLVVGAQRSGSTWLDAVLRSHPDVFMPPHRKEVHFFDDNYDKGIDWYSRFFAGAKPDAMRVGETTPKYLFAEAAPVRIVESIGRVPVISILRRPTDRAASHFRHAQATLGLDGTFADFLESDPSVYTRGLYADQLRRYRELWPESLMLTLIFEETVAAPTEAQQRVATFLGLDPNGFGHTPPNTARTSRAKNPAVMAVARWGGERLRSAGLDRLVAMGRRGGVERIGGARAFIEPTSSELDALSRRYRSSIADLECLLGRQLDAWR